MKTLLVVSELRVDEHAGEEWDDYIAVVDTPSTENVQEWADKVSNRIRRMWDADKGSAGRTVAVEVDASPVFVTMLIDFQIMMKDQFGIVIYLPSIDTSERQTDDPETLETIEKLNNRR